MTDKVKYDIQKMKCHNAKTNHSILIILFVHQPKIDNMLDLRGIACISNYTNKEPYTPLQNEKPNR